MRVSLYRQTSWLSLVQKASVLLCIRLCLLSWKSVTVKRTVCWSVKQHGAAVNESLPISSVTSTEKEKLVVHGLSFPVCCSMLLTSLSLSL